MTTVFLSYSTSDHHFAELVCLKLEEASIHVWRDRGSLRAGQDWANGIERGIAASDVVVVALSSNSAESSYLTFEWAYALGNGRDLLPIKLNECPVHPRLQSIQHLDFSVPGALPWASLIERIQEIEALAPEPVEAAVSIAGGENSTDSAYVASILAYLNQRGIQSISFEKLRERLGPALTHQVLNRLVVNHSSVFRYARLKTGRPGLAKLQP